MDDGHPCGVLNLSDGLKDSPFFRFNLQRHVYASDKFAVQLEQVIDSCTALTRDQGKYIKSCKKLVSDLDALNDYSKSSNSYTCSERLINALKMICTIHEESAKASDLMMVTLKQFSVDELGALKKEHRDFLNTGDAHEKNVTNNIVSSTSQTNEVARKSNDTKSDSEEKINFNVAVKHVIARVIRVDAKKDIVIPSAIWEYLKSYHSLLVRQFGVFSSWQKELRLQELPVVHDARTHFSKIDEKMSSMILAQLEPGISLPIVSMVRNHTTEGYLYMKTSHHRFRTTWKRRWFFIHGDKYQLCYRKRDTVPNGTRPLTLEQWEAQYHVEADLKLSQVREKLNDVDRKFCFQLIMPTSNIILGAESQVVAQQWIDALNKTIEASIHHIAANDFNICCTVNDTKVSKLRAMDGNSVCADCGSMDDVTWACHNLGIIVCKKCSGVHRSLGVSRSKVRSISLDSWEPHQLDLMTQLGNKFVNSVFLGLWGDRRFVLIPEGVELTDKERRDLITDKYVVRRYVDNNRIQQIHRARRTGKNEVILRSGRTRKGFPIVASRNDASRTKSVLLESPGLSPGGRSSADDSSTPSTKSSSGSDLHAVTSCPDLHSLDIAPPFNHRLVGGGNRRPSTDAHRHTVVVNETNKTHRAVFISPPTSPMSAAPGGSDPELETLTTQTDGSSKVTALEMIEMDVSVNMEFFDACSRAYLPGMLETFVLGANPNFSNPNEEWRSPLHMTVKNNAAAATEFLLQNGAKVDMTDQYNQTPLHYAALYGKPLQIPLLIKRNPQILEMKGGPSDIKLTAEEIAVDNKDVNIVTMLRLAAANLEEGFVHFQLPRSYNFVAVAGPEVTTDINCIEDYENLMDNLKLKDENSK